MAGRHRERELEKQLKVEADRGRGLEQQNLQLQKTIQQLRQDCEEASKARGVGTGLRRWRLRGLEGRGARGHGKLPIMGMYRPDPWS